MTSTTPPTGLTPAQASAKGQLASDLDALGLGALADWAWQQYLTGIPETQIFLEMRTQPAYKARFPGMAELQASGHAITEAQYLDYENQAIGLMKSYGVDPKVWGTTQMLGTYIGGQVSLSELSQRLQDASQAVYSTPQATRDYLAKEYGVSHGDLTSYFLDPSVTAPLLQERFAAAQVGGAAATAGFGDLARTSAEQLAQQGVTLPQATSGFDILARNNLAVQGNLAGLENQNTVDQQTAVTGQFSGGAAGQQLSNAEQAQKAAFGGGSVATSQQGATGAGLNVTF
jgi:hypothetical protein